MPNTANVTKETADKFTHMSDQEPERDGLDYGPDDDYMEIVTSVPADLKGDGSDGSDTMEENYSSEGKSADTDMDLGGENYSQDIVQRSDKKAEEEAKTEPEPEKDAAPEEPDKKPAKDKSPAQKRIDQIIKERNEAREQAAYYRGLTEAKPAGDGEDPAPAPTEKPKLEDFESYEDFSEAMADFKIAERDLKNAQSAEVAAKTKTSEIITTQIDAGKEKYEDFQEKVLDNSALAFTPAVVEALTESDNGADLMYELAKDPDELARISRLSPVSMGSELAKIEGRIAGGAETKPEPKKVSSAPAPITPVNTGSGDVSRKEPEDMTMDEYINWRTRGGKRRV
jgi:hypothetical protein